MRNRELQKQHHKIQVLLSQAPKATENDIELMSHWAKYLCVLCAGFLENAISEVYIDFVKCAPKPVANYASSTLKKIRNPKSAKFIEIAGYFNKSWSKDLELFLGEDGRGGAIDSIMNNRHHIAHGSDSGVTIARIREWFPKSVEVVDYIERQCQS